MNKLIGLCTNDVGWPAILHEQGYRISLIEQRIGTKTTSVTPDVVVASNKLSHAIVADCKGGNNIDSGQDSRYKSIKVEHLVMWIHVREKKRFKCSPCYVTNDTHYSQLHPHTTLPFIIFEKNRVRGKGDFGHGDLNRVLYKGASLSNMHEPTVFYPFSIEDGDDLIIRHVIIGLLFWLNKNRPKSLNTLIDDKVVSEILKNIHPHYKHMGVKYQNTLSSKVKSMITSLISRKEFKTVKKKRLDGQLTPSTLKRFKEQCQTIIDDRKVQTTLD